MSYCCCASFNLLTKKNSFYATTVLLYSRTSWKNIHSASEVKVSDKKTSWWGKCWINFHRLVENKKKIIFGVCYIGWSQPWFLKAYQENRVKVSWQILQWNAIFKNRMNKFRGWKSFFVKKILHQMPDDLTNCCTLKASVDKILMFFVTIFTYAPLVLFQTS